jgi:hypothetical protein
MYTKDPDLYDKVQQALETIEYKLFSKDWHIYAKRTIPVYLTEI